MEFNNILRDAFRRLSAPDAFVEESIRITADGMAAVVDRVAEWLLASGCGKGDRIAALTLNRIAAVALEWATYRIGGIWIGIPARVRDVENFKDILEDFQPALILFEQSVVEALYGDIFSYLDAFECQEIDSPQDFDTSRYRVVRLRQETADRVEYLVAGEAVARIRYSSGTSGEPKAIAYTEKTISAIFDNIHELIVRGHEETMIHVVPIVWATGSLIAPTFCNGQKNVFLKDWDVRDFFRAVMKEKSVLTFLVPSQVAEITRFSERSGAAWSKSLRRVLIAGAPTPVSIMRQAKRILPFVEFFITLGQTEASFPITLHRVTDVDLELEPGSRPLVPLGPLTEPYKGSTIDPETGELLLVGNAVAGGKWIPPRQGAAGHFEPLARPHRTGDVVEAGDDGMLHYLGRVAYRPRPGWPTLEAIEAVVNNFDGVKRTCVEKVTGEAEGFVASLTVQLNGPGIEESEIREHFEQSRHEANLPSVSLGTVRFGPVPMTLSGKIRRVPGS